MKTVIMGEPHCLFSRHCEERQRRSNPFLLAARWIASRSLSSGAHSRDPLARNDDPIDDRDNTRLIDVDASAIIEA
jgi:hypothetical protein